MMKNKLTRQPDLETLSAYLDRQLSEAEEQALHSRLSQDIALKRQLDDLRQTRYVLRQTPKVKRPRSFTLSPEMVRQQRFATRAWNYSRMVSAVASVLLIAVIGGQYLLSGRSLGAVAPQESAAFMADEAAEEPMMAMEAPMEESAANAAMDTGLAQEPPTEAAAEAPAAAELAPQPTATLAATLEPGGGGGLPPAEAPTATQEIMGIGGGPTMTPAMESGRMAPTDKLPGDGAPPGMGEVDGQYPEPLQQLAPDDELNPPDQGFQVSAWRLAQAALLVLALIGGILAAYFRKQVR